VIDLLSTRAGASPQDSACAQLLTAVIAGAIRDASQDLTSEERKQCANRKHNARLALTFLFNPCSVFPLYAVLIGSSAPSIRRALLREVPASPDDNPRMPFPPARRAALQARKFFYDNPTS